MNKEEIGHLLTRIVELKTLCEKRCLEKMDTTDTGFGEHNQVESIAFYDNDVTLTVVDSGYDLRDTASTSINIDEIIMTDDEWKCHLLKLGRDIELEREVAKQKEKEEEQTRRKNKYMQLKKEFDPD